MGLADHIENIRQKPEHIRMRYVVACVAVSMIFILAIWVFSLKSGQVKSPDEQIDIDTSDVMDQFNKSKESMKEAADGFNDTLQLQQEPIN